MTLPTISRLVALSMVAIAIIVPGCNQQAPEGKRDTPDVRTSVPTPTQDEKQKTRRSIVPVQKSCTVSATEFSTWFENGVASPNGIVTAANSLQPLNTDCDFYQWSWRMFLWQMSRGEGGLVFNSPPFFDLGTNNRLISNKANTSGPKQIRGGKRDGVDRDGQAGLVSGVLLSQDAGVTLANSLVYYSIHVNELYAYMASGVNSGELTGLTTFPTTAEQRDAVVRYASGKYGVDIKDADTLAIELKSSWVRVNPALDLSHYITIEADIPEYTQTSDKLWTWDGTAYEMGVTLACVGYHLVGSTKDHPEMIWATFEHEDNTPNANYYYVDTNGNTTLHKNWNEDGTSSTTGWLFMDGLGLQESMNQMRMQLEGTSIVANEGQTIGASNTMRSHPFGSAPEQQYAINNTAIISLNNSISELMTDNGTRGHYELVGATWTSNGVPGTSHQIPVVVGSTTLANSTMETYFQYKNCFDCHTGGNLKGLSHIFSTVKPLR